MWVSISVALNSASRYCGQIYLPFPLSCACFCDFFDVGFFSACFLSLIFLLIRCFWHSPVLAAPENLIFFHRQSVAFSFSKWGYAYWVKSGIQLPFFAFPCFYFFTDSYFFGWFLHLLGSCYFISPFASPFLFFRPKGNSFFQFSFTWLLYNVNMFFFPSFEDHVGVAS